MDKIEVTQKVREAAFDAYMTCFETVPNDLWLQALLDGKHDSDEMAQAFARFERDILATRTDATPVAVEMVAELQLSAFLAGRGSIRTKANGNTHESSPGPTMDDYRRMARFALAEGQVDATPVAWEWRLKGTTDWIMQRAYPNRANDRTDIDRRALYPHPPATDVAALVEAATALVNALDSCVDLTPSIIRRVEQALAPFTKGQNDD